MLEELIEMSNRYGADPDYVLAGGGNTSEKIDAILYIKGSGTSLADITAEGFVSMDRPKLSAMLEKPYPEEDAPREAAALADLMDARLPENGEKRPSVETLLHNLFPYRYVLHVHPSLINGLTCSKGAEKKARELLGGDFIWIPIYRPGYALARLCDSELKKFKEETGRDCQVVLLQNHGIFVAADTVEEIDMKMRRIMDALKKNAPKKPKKATKPYDPKYIAQCEEAVSRVYPEKVHVVSAVNADILDLLTNDKTFSALEDPFSPDHIVYCKARYIYVHEIEHLEKAHRDFVAKNGYEPRVICVKDTGAFFAAPTRKMAESARDLFLDAVDVAIYSDNFGGPLPMTQELIDFIVNWEVESYRAKVSES